MTDDVVAKIKDRLDIVDLISGYLKVQKAGTNYKARCPFHNEKTPSFFISPERQIWHCFGCNFGGDHFGFVKKIEGVDFPEALRILAIRAGVELKPFSPQERQYQSQKARLFEICELATRFFEKQLWHSAAGAAALKYLRGRGLNDKTIKNFHLGWAPDSWNALTDFLCRNYKAEEILLAGMIIKSENPNTQRPTLNPGYYDRFRSRIIFPVSDLNGQVVGFSGRIFEQSRAEGENQKSDSTSEIKHQIVDVAKYINTPQSPIYDKSRLLYGLDKAKLEIRQKNRCLVVEGNMDVIMSHQAGAAHVVASSGTALTENQLRIIKRYTDNLDLCFDTDSAGKLATDRGVNLALAGGFNVGVVSIEEKDLKDPADYVAKYGSAWADYAQRSKPFLEFFFESAKKQFDITTALGKKLLSQKLLPFVAALANKIEQAHWVSEFSSALKVREEILFQELAVVQPAALGTTLDNPEPITQAAATVLETQRLNLTEEMLVSLVLKRPELAEKLNPDNEIFLSDKCRLFIKQIDNAGFESPKEVVAQLAVVAEPDFTLGLDIIYLKAQELWKDFEEIELEREFDKLLVQTKKNYVSGQLARLEYDIKEAEKRRDRELLAKLMSEFTKISKELGN